MANEEMTLEALKLCRKTRIFIPANEYLDTAIKALEENTKLKAEIDRLNTQIAESNKEGVSILHDILELREENEQLKKEIENLLVDKECWTCKHEELSTLSEPCYSCDDCVNWERKEQVKK